CRAVQDGGVDKHRPHRLKFAPIRGHRTAGKVPPYLLESPPRIRQYEPSDAWGKAQEASTTDSSYDCHSCGIACHRAKRLPTGTARTALPHSALAGTSVAAR